MFRFFKRLFVVLFIAAAFFTSMSERAYANTTDSTNYGSGGYNNCDYGACTITLTSGGATHVNVIPTSGGACTVQNDIVSVLTDNSTGYSLTMTTSTTNNSMVGGSASIGTSSATAAAPTTLAMNTWGYRVDGLSGFGTGPTTSQNNGSVPSVSFAGVPASNQTATAIASSGSLANPAVSTTVWYGVCANATLPSGAYSTTITYTAVTN